ncbi:hypothetical protein RclHR1_17730001 [Rhizophagus clarus]|uniref:Uncharacterized protein n=1 Tax=Rhizophagus clarus TaxID=94130 RepID=A0A2Z6QZF2_9GLOM|nr:hypothetical protein RclHR1_17730001 [Rhizophagus clarus]
MYASKLLDFLNEPRLEMYASKLPDFLNEFRLEIKAPYKPAQVKLQSGLAWLEKKNSGLRQNELSTKNLGSTHSSQAEP